MEGQNISHEGHRQRMRTRVEQYGLESLAPHEVLEYLLYITNARRDTNGIAHALLERFGSFTGVLEASEEELCSVAGIGPASARMLHLLPEVSRYYEHDRTSTEGALTTTERLVTYLKPRFAGARQEKALLLSLDSRSRVKGVCWLKEGNSRMVGLEVKDVVSAALRGGTESVVLCHNHPNGVPLPSREDLAATENIVLGMEGKLDLVDAGKKVKAICDKYGFDINPNQKIYDMSVSQKQTVEIIKVLYRGANILILDEPMVGLDPQQIIEVRDLILDLKQSHTVILSSHILPEIQSVCDRVVVLNEGSLVADDTPEHLSAKLSAASRLRLRVAAPAESVIQLLKTIRDVETVTQQNPQEPGCCELLIEAAQGSDIRRAVFCRLSERQYPILYMALEEMTLESIFLSLTGNG